MNDFALQLNNLGKSYRIGASVPQNLGRLAKIRRTVTAPFDYLSTTLRKATDEEIIWALKDISFAVQPGEVVGLIGHNGAGKSTLLKVLSRITEPSAGRAEIQGRVASLLEVGTGFHGDLTGRENIYMNGTVLGMSRAEIKRKFDEIVAFAGVEKFVDTQVKRYSSGMNVRLGFAVAAHLEPEILLIDEVLAVGDVAFQKKALGKMDEVAHSGRTVLLVSHNMGSISALCPRTILLKDGQVLYDGQTSTAINLYLEQSASIANFDLREREDRTGTGLVRCTATWLENAQGERVHTVQSGDDVKIVLEYESDAQELGALNVAFALKSSLGQISNLESEIAGFEIPNPPTHGRVYCHLKHLPLNVAQYSYNVCVRVNDIIVDFMSDVGGFTVDSGDFFQSGRPSRAEQGQFLIESAWQIEPTLAHQAELA